MSKPPSVAFQEKLSTFCLLRCKDESTLLMYDRKIIRCHFTVACSIAGFFFSYPLSGGANTSSSRVVVSRGLVAAAAAEAAAATVCLVKRLIL